MSRNTPLHRRKRLSGWRFLCATERKTGNLRFPERAISNRVFFSERLGKIAMETYVQWEEPTPL